ncbi:site-specific DNA-methyltransferase [Vibrio harveyi]|nr:site-specific DNA-methyltransferase [Vibrio harveyi]
MSNDQTNVESYEFEPIKGYPMLNWKGKRPFRSTQYFPAQLKEVYGQEDDNGWINKIFWGDNLQVMSHLLKEFRGKVDLIYIDPPFDSKADYKKSIKLKGKNLQNDSTSFEEKQYTDIWSNDEYLQFIYERLLLAKELLSPNGNIFVHCDYHKNHLIRCLLDEVFGQDKFVNEICWRRKGGSALGSMNKLSASFDTIFWYAKGTDYTLNPVYSDAPQEYIDKQFKFSDEDGRRYMATVMRSPSPRPNLMYDYKGYKMPPNGWAVPLETMKELDERGYLHFPDSKSKQIYKKIYLDEYKGHMINTLWSDISTLKGSNSEIENYPTQKPVALIDRIIQLASNENDLIFDFFMGSGSTLVSAEKNSRRFIGADINRGALVTTSKRLSNLSANFEYFVVNNYEIFRNPVEARDLLIDALEIQKLDSNTIYDGEKDGFKVKIMPVNRIATKEDLNDLIQGFPYKQFEERKEANPNQPVEEIMLVCMGHEPGLGAILENESGYKMKVEVVDILRDKSDLTFKYDSEASIEIKGGKLVIEAFYPRNLLQKLSQQKDDVTEWREMVESIMIDWNFDGAVMEPTVIDIPAKDEFVAGEYEIPEGANNIKIKITDLLSESYEEVIAHG